MTNSQDFGSIQLDSPEPESVEAVRSDIEATRTDLVETVTELSDRLNPTKRVAAVAQGVSEHAKNVVEQAGEATKDTTARVQDVARAGVRRGRQFSNGRETQLIGVTLVVVGLVLVWRLWRRHR